jgi:hypothetical protein
MKASRWSASRAQSIDICKDRVTSSASIDAAPSRCGRSDVPCGSNSPVMPRWWGWQLIPHAFRALRMPVREEMGRFRTKRPFLSTRSLM